ncbi:TonB-dependent receptor [Litorimonas sp. RW-G-Af-16]|uniref:TonB-dependent receptor n=1 Tax=Litorimonas sp. RW-G-Af-16 TaxID=3241168 RepID=UPI00390CB352
MKRFLPWLLISCSTAAWAQDMDDVITVYDTRRTTLSAPLSVDLINGSEIDTTALVHPAELLNRVAGVNIHRGSGQEHLTAIRSPVLVGGAGAGSFLYLQDGVPLRAAGFANVNGLFEGGTEFARQIEVIKGPGPATYGSNAVHGLINIVSRDVDNYRRLKVMGSDRGFASVQAIVPVSDGFQIASSLTHDSGFRENSGFDQQKIELKYQGSFGHQWDVDWLTAFNNLNQETAGFLQGDDAYLDDDLRFTNPNPEAFRDGKSYRTQARFERYVLDGQTKLALTPYARRAELRFLRHFVPGQALEKNAHNSIGLQTALYKDDDYNIGVDVEYSEGSLYEFQANPTRFSFTQGLHYDYDVKSFVGAVYAEKDVRLADDLILDLGLRAEYTSYDYTNNASVGVSGRFIRVGDRKDGFLTVTPKASLQYIASDHVRLYARAARGSRAPQVTDLYSVQQNQVAGEADVETLDSLEAGLKWRDGNWQVELAGFTMWKDNFFFRNANGFNVVNGKTRHVGAELSFSGALTDWLSVSGDGTLAKHTYDFTLDEGSPANNITSGDRVDTAPNTLAHMRLTARPSSSLMAEIEWRHMGSYFTNPGNTASYPGHDIFVLRSSFDVSSEVSIFGRVDNLFDARYADRADFAFGNERYFPGRPRTVFLGLSSEF